MIHSGPKWLQPAQSFSDHSVIIQQPSHLSQVAVGRLRPLDDPFPVQLHGEGQDVLQRVVMRVKMRISTRGLHAVQHVADEHVEGVGAVDEALQRHRK